jgi:hypothetical protein
VIILDLIKSNSGLDALMLAEQLYYGSNCKLCTRDFLKLCHHSLEDLRKSGIPFFSACSMSIFLAKNLTIAQCDMLDITSLIQIISEKNLFSNISEKLIQNKNFDNQLMWFIDQNKPHWDKYINLLCDMAQNGYTETWKKDAEIFVEKTCGDLNKSIWKYDVNTVLKYMSQMKNIPIPDIVRMYMSYYSPSFSFSLNSNMCLQNIHDLMNVKYLLRVIAHEFLHGFSSVELANLFASAITNDEYFRDVHTENVWFSGDEEEFVKAAEHFIVYKAGLYSLEDIKQIQDGLYGNSLPFMVIVFDLLVKHNEVPSDYNQWLIDRFNDGSINVGHLKEQCDHIILGYSEGLYKAMDKHDMYCKKINDLGI